MLDFITKTEEPKGRLQVKSSNGLQLAKIEKKILLKYILARKLEMVDEHVTGQGERASRCVRCATKLDCALLIM